MSVVQAAFEGLVSVWGPTVAWLVFMFWEITRNCVEAHVYVPADCEGRGGGFCYNVHS